MNCRFCHTPLSDVFIDLGNAPASNSFLTEAQLSEAEIFMPLKVFVCPSCFLVQTADYKKPDSIFDDTYVYFSSYSKSWLEHARRYVEAMTARFNLTPASYVVELASNDGYLLQYFLKKNIRVLGIEPTANTAQVAIDKGIPTVIDFFGVRLATELAKKEQGADLLLGNNVLAHVPDINDFVGGMKILLKPAGIITMEFPHLMRLVENNQFDTIYHEHFSYLSLSSVQKVFGAHGLELFDVEELPTHGGSLRIFAKHREDDTKAISENVASLLKRETESGMNTLAYYRGFQRRTLDTKLALLEFLTEQKQAGKIVAAYGAAAKGNTLLNYCGIKSDLITCVADANPNKQGKFLPGSHIPVVAEACFTTLRPDFIIIFPWNLTDEITRQLGYVRDWGCRFVIPIPTLRIIG
jgi:SAM-dependent methyltransferase